MKCNSESKGCTSKVQPPWWDKECEILKNMQYLREFQLLSNYVNRQYFCVLQKRFRNLCNRKKQCHRDRLYNELCVARHDQNKL